jgi:hypothetical protein
MEPCEQRGEISKIKTIVNDLQHIIKGNGQPGMEYISHSTRGRNNKYNALGSKYSN